MALLICHVLRVQQCSEVELQIGAVLKVLDKIDASTAVEAVSLLQKAQYDQIRKQLDGHFTVMNCISFVCIAALKMAKALHVIVRSGIVVDQWKRLADKLGYPTSVNC